MLFGMLLAQAEELTARNGGSGPSALVGRGNSPAEVLSFVRPVFSGVLYRAGFKCDDKARSGLSDAQRKALRRAGFGNGQRKLIGLSTRSPHGFTRIEIADDGSISTTAFIAPDFVEPLALENLPSTLGDGPFRLTLQAKRPN